MVVSVPAGWPEQDDQQPSPFHQARQQIGRALYEPETLHSIKEEPISAEVMDVASLQQHYNRYLEVENRTLSIKDYCDIFTKVSENPCVYKCNVCGKTVTNRWHHASIHKPQHNKCPKCQQTFTRKDNMKAHMRLKHGMFQPIIV